MDSFSRVRATRPGWPRRRLGHVLEIATALVAVLFVSQAEASNWNAGGGVSASQSGACQLYYNGPWKTSNPNNIAGSSAGVQATIQNEFGQTQQGPWCVVSFPLNGGTATAASFISATESPATDVPCSSSDAPVSAGYYGGSTSPPVGSSAGPMQGVPLIACSGGYQVQFSGGANMKQTRVVAGQTKYYVQGEYAYACANGKRQTCTSGNATPNPPTSAATPPAETCGAGQTQAVVAGKTKCFDANGNQVNTNGGQGGSDTTQTGNCSSTVNRVDGAKTTTCTDANGKEVSRTVEPGANPTEGDTYCKENKDDPQCAKAGKFSGTCTETPSCTGDSIQCAQAEQAFLLRCGIEKESTLSALGLAAMIGNDPDKGQFPSAAAPTTTPVGSSLDQSPFLSGGCPPDATIALTGGRSFVIPWSRVCAPLQWLGYAMVAVSLLIAARIVGVFG